MTLAYIAPSLRVRRTPFSRRVEEAGVKAYSVYNHMLIPQVFRSVEDDYAHLKRAVQVWDVACERQVEINGPDALKLVQMTTPRDISRMATDQCFYIPMVDEHGGMLNDPVAVKLGQDRYWLSISDSDMLYYCKGLAAGFALDVRVFEPDVSPLAIQGPYADRLVARVFGEEIVNTRFFRYKSITFEGQEMVIARSGWSHQGGFEIYVDGAQHGEALWDVLFTAGRDLDVRAGCPNLIERIEAGLLSMGSDIMTEHTPFEVGLGKYCDLETAQTCLGHAALCLKRDPKRQIRAVAIEGPPVPSINERWPMTTLKDQPAGYISSATWSPDFDTNVAIGMLEQSCWQPGSRLVAKTPVGERAALVKENFWI
jgi:dimethylsulfoniopropionate demethylase